MKLQRAFEIARGDVVAFVGAGGKTSVLANLGYELADAGWRVLATTSTRIAEAQLDLIPHALHYQSGAAAVSAALSAYHFVFLYGDIQSGKAYGPPLAWLRELLDNADSDVLLIESDGARGLPLKAPFAHEPVIPGEATLVVPVASLAVVGKPLDEEHVYNPQAMIEKYGFAYGGAVHPAWIAQVIRDEELGLKGIPENARAIAFLNQIPERGYWRGRARMIARLALKSGRLSGVALGDARGAEPVHEVYRAVGAMVLAAGMSSRMGRPKVLLPWNNGETIIEHIVEQLMRARVENIVVVTGHCHTEVKNLLKPLGVKIVHNKAYKTGEMLSSFKAGLRAMPDHVAAAMVVLGDQPRIQPYVIYRILRTYFEGRGDIVAPSYQKRRGHPIVIARRFWNEILQLKGNQAPRDVINAYQEEIAYVEVNSDSVIHDVDTPADYNRERNRAGLSYHDLRRETDE